MSFARIPGFLFYAARGGVAARRAVWPTRPGISGFWRDAGKRSVGRLDGKDGGGMDA